MDDAKLPQLITPSSGTMPAQRLLSPGLKKLLTQGEDSGGACRLIALNATLRGECERALPMLERAKEPAAREEVLEVVARRMVAYGVTTNLAFQNGVTWESYLAGLEDLPLYAIEDAFDRWDRGEGTKGNLAAAGFAPRPAQVAMLAQAAKAEVWMAAYRARKALEHVEKTQGRDVPPEVRKAVGADLAALAASLKGGKGMPNIPRAGSTPQEAARRLREAAGRQAPGEVL